MPFTQGGGCTDCKSIIGCRCEKYRKALERYENDHPEIFDSNYKKD